MMIWDGWMDRPPFSFLFFDVFGETKARSIHIEIGLPLLETGWLRPGMMVIIWVQPEGRAGDSLQ